MEQVQLTTEELKKIIRLQQRNIAREVKLLNSLSNTDIPTSGRTDPDGVRRDDTQDK